MPTDTFRLKLLAPDEMLEEFCYRGAFDAQIDRYLIRLAPVRRQFPISFKRAKRRNCAALRRSSKSVRASLAWTYASALMEC